MKEQFERDGFILIAGFLKTDELSGLNASIKSILNYTNHANSPKETHYFRGTRIVYENNVLHRIVWAQGLEPRFSLGHRIKELKTIINSLLGTAEDNDLYQIINQLHLKAPNDGVSFQFHQDAENRSYGTPDWRDVLDNGSFIQTVLALGPLNKENGTLRFLPGSHREGFVDLPHHPEKLNELKNKYGEYSLECSAGDLVLFHPFCIHGSDTNKSNEMRKVFINGFCPAGANKKHYPGCGVGKKI